MASGDTLIAWDAGAYFPPTSNPATPSTSGADVPCLLFDDTTSETAYFSGVMPGQYDGTSAINAILPWKFSTYVGSQTCDWEVSWCRVDDDTQSVESLTFATAQTVLATEASATGELDYATVAFTNAQADGIQGGEAFVLRVVRDATGGTASPGDAELYWVSVELN